MDEMLGHRLTREDEMDYCYKTMIPDIAGTFSGMVAVVGGGKQMWDELELLFAVSEY